MLRLFKKYLGIFVAGEFVIFALMSALVYDGLGWGKALAAAAVLSLGLFLFCQVRAGLLHRQLLGLLYSWQKPGEFVQAYSQLAEQKGVPGNVAFSVRAYLSNGYLALGEADKALAVLDNVPGLSRRQAKAGEAILAVNRCSAYLAMGDGEKAGEQYALLCALLKENRGDRELEKQEGAAKLLGIRLAVLENRAGQEDADYVREALKGQGSAYHKTELRFLLGQIYSQLGNKGFAKSYFKDTAEKGGSTWQAKQAGDMLRKIQTQ